jgi:hypothetical protein
MQAPYRQLARTKSKNLTEVIERSDAPADTGYLSGARDQFNTI